MSRLLTAITALLLLATIAQARPEWLYKPTAGLEGEYTEHRVRGFGYGTPEGAIYQGQDRKQAFVDVQYEQVDIETGETNTVTITQAVPAIEAYYAIGMDAPREATGAEMEARAANAAAQAQAAYAAEMDALLSRPVDANDPTQGTARDQIIKIEGVVEWFIQAGAGLTRPVRIADATQRINTFIESLENAQQWALTSKANRYATTLLGGIIGFEAEGITAEQINAAWEYMGKPLPEQ